MEKLCVQISIGAWTEAVSGTYLWDNKNPGLSYFESYDTRVERFYARLCEGGYVIDKTVLADHPEITHWAIMQPLENGRLEGDLGAMDCISATTLALWWLKRGARVGRRIGNMIVWNDGTQEEIIDYGE